MEDGPGPVQLNMLLAEYKASLRQANQLAMRMEWTGLAGFTLLALLTAFLFSARASIPIAIAWVAPLAYLIVFGALIGLASQQVEAAWRTRILSLRLQRLGQYEPPARDVPQDPLNLWRLSWRLRLLAATPAAVFAGLFLLTAFFCARSVYHHSHLQGTGFIFFYLILALVELVALGDLYAGLPRLYRSAYQSVAAVGGLPLRPTPPLQTIGRWLAPLPAGLLDHSRAFWAGFLAPLLLIGLSTAQLPILNALFRGSVDWSFSQVPALAIVALGVLVFLVLELLLQQAIALLAGLGREADLAPLPVLQILLRWLAALALAFILGQRGLLALFLVISAYEVIGILWGRLNARAHPVLALLWGAAALPLRFAAGVLVWGGPAWDYTPYLMLGVFVYFLSLGFNAAAQHREARARAAQGLPSDAYFLQRGAYWRQVGLWSAFVTGGLLFLAQALVENCDPAASELLAKVYGFCQVKGGSMLVYTLVGKVNGFLIAFDLLVIVLLLVMLAVWLVAWRQPRPRPAAAPLDPPAEQSEPVEQAGLPAAEIPAQLEQPASQVEELPAAPPDIPAQPEQPASQVEELPAVPPPAPRPGWLWANQAGFYYGIALLVILIGFLRFSAAWAFGGVEIAVLGAIISK